jgi:hypothetical protein
MEALIFFFMDAPIEDKGLSGTLNESPFILILQVSEKR